MHVRRVVTAAAVLALLAAAVPGRVMAEPKSAPARTKTASQPVPVAPESVPHSIAMFLSELSRDGKETVTYRATAFGTHFFIEEPAGVTVYAFSGGGYRRAAFLSQGSLAEALKKYEPISSSKK